MPPPLPPPPPEPPPPPGAPPVLAHGGLRRVLVSVVLTVGILVVAIALFGALFSLRKPPRNNFV